MPEEMQHHIGRRRFLEIGAKGSLALSLGGAIPLSGACHASLASLNEKGPVQFPRLAHQKIQSPEHYGPDGCMTSMWFGAGSNKMTSVARYTEQVKKAPSIAFLDTGQLGLTSRRKEASANYLNGIPADFARNGHIPFLSYEVGPQNSKDEDRTLALLEDIPNSKYDQEIGEDARAMRDFGRRHGGFFIRTMREMTLEENLWSRDSTRFKEVWRHIWSLFDQAGANEFATWVWNPIVGRSEYKHAPDFYPGDEYVDWIGLNAYNFYGQPWAGTFDTFSDLFEASYVMMRTRYPAKPIFIVETGTDEGPRKADWVRSTFEAIKTRFPGIKALNWWSEDWSSVGVKDFDSRIDSSAESLASFKDAIADPYFLATLPYHRT